MDDEFLMRAALEEARLALAEGEVPIGSVVVLKDRIIGCGHNRKESLNDPTAHAEILAIRQAAESIGSWRLCGATLYATAEPCTMCVGAIIHARLDRLVFGCREPKFGAVFRFVQDGSLRDGNHELVVKSGVLEDECAGLMREFFAGLRSPRS
ncbi:MAG: nucleoside deaminase [Candidatus Coatesbacteria bacterium]|nr:nucleoside deaminase [Candidatus Coatesbacteria bacterium]